MSSFVVDKKELMKAAGFVAAFIERDENRNGIYMWNFKHNRRFNSDDVIASFDMIHKMNADSVQEQYGDKYNEYDSEPYLDDFREIKKKTEEMLTFRYEWYIQALKNNIYSFDEFCRSILYQIEDDKKQTQVKNFLNDLKGKFIEILCNLDTYHADIFSWGTFDFSDGSEEKEYVLQKYNMN